MQINSDSDLEKLGPGYLYDVDSGDVNLPDVKLFLDQVIEVMECMNQQEMVDLQNKDEEEYKAEMEKRFPQFSFRYYAIFQKIISGDDITPLIEMLAQIERVKCGEIDIEEAEKNIGQSLANKYVYPTFNK